MAQMYADKTIPDLRMSLSSTRLLGVPRNREGVSVRVFEPGHLVAARGGPDAEVVLFEETESFEDDPFLRHRRDDLLDAGDFPSKDGEAGRLEVGLDLRYADHGAVGVEHHGEAVVVYEAQTEDPFVEGARLVEVQRW